MGWAFLRGLGAFGVWVFMFMGLIAATRHTVATFIGATFAAVLWFAVATMHDWKGGCLFGPLLALVFSLVLILTGYLVHGGGR